MKRLFGTLIVESFRFRTCVDPEIKKESAATEIIYESLTAQGFFQNFYRGFHFCFINICEGSRNSINLMLRCWDRFWNLDKFVKSDEGLPCVNTIEKAYLGLLVIVFALGIISLFRLSHFKVELRKVFDSRRGFYYSIVYYILYIPMNIRLWYFVANIRHQHRCSHITKSVNID